MPIIEEPASIYRLSVGDAFAEIALYGSTVLSWHPASAPADVSALFLSSATKPGKPYRGGVPLVFPLFGEVKDHDNIPEILKKCSRHGFCRDREWKLGKKDDQSDSVQLSMVLSSKENENLFEKFPFPFTVEHTVTLTKNSLKQELHVTHESSSEHDQMPFHALFHNYFRVASATAKASGLKGIGYKDKVAGKTVTENEIAEQGWDQEIDRVYQGSAPVVKIATNDGSGTAITLERSKSIPDTTIWNPGQAAADGMADMQPGGWKEFVCAEPGHVDSFVFLDKGKDWTGSQTMHYSVDPASQSYTTAASVAAGSAITGGMAALGLGASKAASTGEGGAKTGTAEAEEKSTTAGSDAKESKLEQENAAAENADDKTPLSKAVHTAVKNHVNDADGPHADKTDAEKDKAAALVIQRNYRKYQGKREAAGMTLSPDARWGDAMGRVRLDGATKAANCGDKNDAHSRWKRGGLMVGQLAGSPGAGGDEGTEKGPVEGGPSLRPGEKLKDAIKDDSDPAQNGDQKAPEDGQPKKTESEGMVGDVPGANDDGKVDNIRSIAKKDQHGLRLIERWTKGAPAQELSKVMEAQYWLEMVDRKHRYGSNLKHYHEAWEKDADTKDNFFKWLDEGNGKDLDIEECPRERLEKERITYLSSEQRGNYIVDIKEGKLIWRRNGKPVDTSKNKSRDMGNGRGIVELGPEEREEMRKKREEKAAAKGRTLKEDGSDDSSSSSSSSSSDEDEEDEETRKEEAAHYGGDASSAEKGKKLFSTAGTWDALLRKTIGNNTWIYVYNSRHELFVGIKQTGKFQHSSFLYGGRVLSAGLLRAKNGLLTSLSPLSGHYRAGTAHFRFFVASLQDSGANLEHVTLSKSLLLLRGLEMYGKMNKKIKGGAKKDKKKGEEKKNQTEKESEGKGDAKEHHSFREKLGLKSHHRAGGDSAVEGQKAH